MSFEAKPKREKMMAMRERKIPCSDFPEWKRDLESTGVHVIDSTPIPNQNGYCNLRFGLIARLTA
jgi:hypothetical protein